MSYSLTLTGSITYIPLATVISVDGPGITVGEVDAVILSSTFKDYNPTLPEGEASLNVEHNGADPAIIAFRTMLKNAPIPNLSWKITYQDGYVDTFQGFPKGYSISDNENETRLVADIPIRLKTPITTTAPS